MNGARTAGADPRLQSSWLMRRILWAYLFVLLIAVVALAGLLMVGRQQAIKERATIRNGNHLKFWSEGRLVNTGGVPDSTFAPVQQMAESRSDYSAPINPYTGKACAEYHRGNDQYIGDFSYVLLLDHWGYLEGSAIVMYSPMPTVTQRRYCQFFMRPATNFDPDLSRPGPKVVWLGGECGNLYQYLARGLAPADAIAELNWIHKAADPYDNDDLRDELVFLTPEEYAARQSKIQQKDAGAWQLAR
jgi:hypothetical protein